MFLKYSAKSAKINCDNSHNSGKNTNPSLIPTLHDLIAWATCGSTSLGFGSVFFSQCRDT